MLREEGRPAPDSVSGDTRSDGPFRLTGSGSCRPWTWTGTRGVGFYPVPSRPKPVSCRGGGEETSKVGVGWGTTPPTESGPPTIGCWGAVGVPGAFGVVSKRHQEWHDGSGIVDESGEASKRKPRGHSPRRGHPRRVAETPHRRREVLVDRRREGPASLEVREYFP